MHESNETGHDRTPIRVDDGVTLLDLGFQGQPGVIGSWLLAGDGDVVLVEVGPGSTRGNLEQMVHRAGYTMADVSRLIVTHIHLDHAGAAGLLMRDYPHLRLSVPADAAQFLVSVDRLWSSAKRIYGDMMESLWGQAVDIDPDRVDGIRDGDRLRVAGTTLRVCATPGHTGTHVSFLDEQRNILFTGDAVGARLAGSDVVVPTLSPPELDIAVWTRTIDSISDMRPARLAVTHMGVFDDVDWHLAVFIRGIGDSFIVADRVLRTPEDEPALADALAETMIAAYEADGEDADANLQAMQLAMPSYLAAKGILRVFRKNGRFDDAS